MRELIETSLMSASMKLTVPDSVVPFGSRVSWTRLVSRATENLNVSVRALCRRVLQRI